MCGIVGYLEAQGLRSQDEARRRLEGMRDRLRHRGPDDQGSWIAPSGCVALGHRRLSILDLSPHGRQPMASTDQRYHLVYNGEVYNYRELRRELAECGHSFRGHSDTEVVLAAFCQWGPEASLARLNGMFAMALWDSQRQSLLLARDRFGKKPLYYGRVGEAWVFASELKALRTLPEFANGIDRSALTLYIRFGYVPTPLTIYEGISKLPAGSYLWLEPPFQALPYSTWKPQGGDLESVLRRAVQSRMVSDVPLGAFLSGGIDSSLVVALMQEVSTQPVRTFTLGFQDDHYDEAVYARRVAHRLGTQHSEHYVTPSEALEVIPLLPTMYDEPFADSSQIPTYLVSRLARTQVTVCLSGDGGDELFGGYNRHLWAPPLWRALAWIPPGLRRFLARWLAIVSLEKAGRWLGHRVAYPQDKLTKLGELLTTESPRQLYKFLVSPWRNPENLVMGGTEPLTLIDSEPFTADMADWMMHLDARTYLPDDILVKIDRASMAVGLEARCPLLDPEVARVAWSLSTREKIRGRQGKLPLRKLLYQRLPPDLFERPKAGFSIPLGSWLRAQLRPWAENLLARIPHQGFLNPDPILQRWRQHQEKRRDWSASLWTILMFQAWLEQH